MGMTVANSKKDWASLWGSILFLLLCVCPSAVAQTDSVRVESMLARALTEQPRQNLVLYFARQFLGTPYVGQTLEVNREEQLVVNLREMDCTTLVETALALALTAHDGSTRYADYCRNLTRLRYFGGKLQGYESRNHYFHQWIKSNEQQGLVSEVRSEEAPFTAIQTLHLDYMSKHPQLYPALRNNPELVQRIAVREAACEGEKARYIPREQLGGSKNGALGVVRDGDIVAIVTRKAGLDTSHLGIAVWGDDDRLHLLNASQIHKKVVVEPMTLQTYMTKHPSQLGIRIIRMR